MQPFLRQAPTGIEQSSTYLFVSPMRVTQKLFISALATLVAGCLPISDNPKPGPDKQSVGTFYGALSGAGSGAVIGAELTAASGPGAMVGAGFGAVFGMLSGLGTDLLEEDTLRREAEARRLRELSWAHEVLGEHYARRLELHPNRDIFPADVFFFGDETRLRQNSAQLVSEIARLSKRQSPWSRILITAYAMSDDPNSEYAHYLARKRANEIALQFIRAGIEPRRVVTNSMVISEPILIDPHDRPLRYAQAIEFVPLNE